MDPKDRVGAEPQRLLRIREAVRALILDPSNRILLVEFRFPNTGPVWATPGGGIDVGERPVDALERELREELGMREPNIGPPVWERTHIVPFVDNSFDGQHEVFFLVSATDAFEPQPLFSWEQLNAEFVFALKWWTVDEISASSAVFAPRKLGELLSQLLIDMRTDDVASGNATLRDVGV